MTGLPNRYLFTDRLSHALLLSRRRNMGVALIFLDIDDFKSINDRWGHDRGDELLREAAARMTASVREMDTVCRFGGDEFTIVLPDVNSRKEVEGVVRRLVETFREPFSLGEQSVYISVSVGVALSDIFCSANADDLLRQADLAMYRAKAKGKDTYAFAEEREKRSSK